MTPARRRALVFAAILVGIGAFAFAELRKPGHMSPRTEAQKPTLLLLTSLPLMFGLVPPNRIYGFRTRRTLANRELWFRANRFSGWALFIAAATSAAVFAFDPAILSGRSASGLFVFVVPLVLAILASFAYVHVAGRDR